MIICNNIISQIKFLASRLRLVSGSIGSWMGREKRGFSLLSPPHLSNLNAGGRAKSEG